MTLVGINYQTDPANPGYKHHTCVIERWASAVDARDARPSPNARPW